MPTTHTEDEIRAAKVAAMGPELGELHYLLWHDLTWLHFEWRQFVELFGIEDLRFQIMNESAPRFFWSLERVLWQDILLALSRLADPAATSGQQNLTFRRLLSALPAAGPRNELVTALDEFESKVGFARNWRHSRFAHRNLNHAAEPDAHPLAHASRSQVIAALQAATEVMNLIELQYQDATTRYEASFDSSGGASDLLLCLERGLHARRTDEERDELWRSQMSFSYPPAAG